MSNELKIEDLCYNSFFDADRKTMGFDVADLARVISEHKGSYIVKNAEGEYSAEVTGKSIFLSASREDYPVTGDWVAINKLDAGKAIITGILPRQSVLRRKYGDENKRGDKAGIQLIAANIDTAFVVESVGRDESLNRFERYLSIIKGSGIVPAVILNKIDLISDQELKDKKHILEKRFPEAKIIFASTYLPDGTKQLADNILAGKTYCFLGSSGVGKSSLINGLIGHKAAKTGHISEYSGKGKHVTTSRQMYFLDNGGILIDNPGIREVGIVGTKNDLDMVFNEISTISSGCKFRNCTHTNEPGCKVLLALDANSLDRDQYENYINLCAEVDFSEMTSLKRHEKERSFGKFMKNAKKDLSRYGHKDY